MRPLSQIEEGFSYINMFYPFTVVCVLKFQNGPLPDALRSSLDRIKRSHPLLNVSIKEQNGRLWFNPDKSKTPIPLHVIQRVDDNQWHSVARTELNSGFENGYGPLMKTIYLLPTKGNDKSEIILSFHHAVIDSVSLLFIIDQLLDWSGSNFNQSESDKLMANEALHMLPLLKETLPSSIKGPRFLLRVIPFMIRQMRNELNYRISSKNIKDVAIPFSSENDFLTIGFTEEETSALVKWARTKKLTINSIITASMLLTINRHSYGDSKKLLQAIQFANLRPYLNPPIDASFMGTYISMLRFNVPLSEASNIPYIAENIDKQYLKSAKRSEKFIFALLSKMLVRKTIRAHDARLGAVALSYTGWLPLKRNYGNIKLENIHALITNNCLGAELTGFGKICNGRLSIDLNYLIAETSNEKATILAEEIKSSLMQLIQNQ